MSISKVIAWDFDGVLNANIRDGRFLWADRFEEDFGQSLEIFQRMVFAEDFEAVLTGKEDLLDRLEGWAHAVGFKEDLNRFITYWFERDIYPDAEMLALCDRLAAHGIRQVIATNNEWRRATMIADHNGFAARVGQVFAAGPMRVCKPDPAFFRQITETLGVAASDMILIDDSVDNVEAAQQEGWAGYFFTETSRDGLVAYLNNVLGDVL